MKNKTLIIALIILSFFCNPSIVPAQQENRGTSVRFNESGILIEFKTETDPPQSGNQFEVRGTTHVKGERNIAHRIFVNQASGGIFGYDLEVEPTTVPNHFKLSIKPLSVETLNTKPLSIRATQVTPLQVKKIPSDQIPVQVKERITQKATGAANSQNSTKVSGSNPTVVTDQNKIDDGIQLTVSKSLKYPPAFLIEDGGMFALDVLVNPQTGVKIVDLIRISSETKLATTAKELQPMRSAKELEPMRDFSPDAVELTVKNFKFLINDQAVLGADSPVRGGVTGTVIWLYLPGRGRFIFSLVPREGYDFQKIGKIQDNKISFQIAADRYEWISSTTVFGSSGGGWNLWVLHDADYAPQNEILTSNGGYLIGASDRIEYLLKKK
jgi:hypothetical protein